MAQLKFMNVYEVPDGYFDTVPQNILDRVRKQQPAKVISLKPFRRMARYAVAAILIGVMAVGGWLMQRPVADTVTTAKIENTIHKASDEEILNFIQNDEASYSEPILNSDEEIDSTDMKAMLADVSDKDLEQFVNESSDQNNTLSN
jgi:hypothetical protein